MITIHICQQTDLNNLNYINVCWKSIITNNSHHNFVFYLLHNINDEILISGFAKRFKLLFPNVTIITFFRDFTDNNLLKIHIPNILNLPKILYLDCQLIVVNDLAGIWELDCGEMGLCLKTSLRPDLKETNGHKAGNTSVMLMDLEILRKHDFVDKILVYNSPETNECKLINIYAKGKYNELKINMNVFINEDDHLISDPVILNTQGQLDSLSDDNIYKLLWKSHHDILLELSKPSDKNGIGILTYDTENLGDWTQSFAALYLWWIYFDRPNKFEIFLKECIETSQLGSHPIIWINRDTISESRKPDNINKVILLCNAWWMHPTNEIYNIITPKWIQPVYISVHITSEKILTEDAIIHFKKYEPIGCRDLPTQKLLQDYGIKAYFFWMFNNGLKLQ